MMNKEECSGEDPEHFFLEGNSCNSINCMITLKQNKRSKEGRGNIWGKL